MQPELFLRRTKVIESPNHAAVSKHVRCTCIPGRNTASYFESEKSLRKWSKNTLLISLMISLKINKMLHWDYETPCDWDLYLRLRKNNTHPWMSRLNFYSSFYLNEQFRKITPNNFLGISNIFLSILSKFVGLELGFQWAVQCSL